MVNSRDEWLSKMGWDGLDAMIVCLVGRLSKGGSRLRLASPHTLPSSASQTGGYQRLVTYFIVSMNSVLFFHDNLR